MNIPVTFTLDLSKQYEHLKIAVCICPDEMAFYSQLSRITKIAKPRGKNNRRVGGFHVAFKSSSSGQIRNPTSLIILKKGYTIPVVVHELFHAARHYFKVTGHGINEDHDETFAHLLGNMVKAFLEQTQPVVETSRLASLFKSLLGL